MRTKKPSIKLNPENKGKTRARIGLTKAGKLDRTKLAIDISKQKEAVKKEKPKSAARAKAVKKLKQDIFAKNFAKKKK